MSVAVVHGTRWSRVHARIFVRVRVSVQTRNGVVTRLGAGHLLSLYAQGYRPVYTHWYVWTGLPRFTVYRGLGRASTGRYHGT